MKLAEEARFGIFTALAERLKQGDRWIPPPPAWSQRYASVPSVERQWLWTQKPPEEKLGEWITAPDDDYIALAEALLAKEKRNDIRGSRTARGGDDPPEGVIDEVVADDDEF